MPECIRTPDEKFQKLSGYSFKANWFDWDGIGMHYVDGGPKEVPIMLCLDEYILRRIAEE